MTTQVSKKRKFVQDGVFKAELNEFLTRELAEDGYSGVEVKQMNVNKLILKIILPGARHPHQDRDHHHGHSHPERPGREGQEDS